jgi:hypothetical protein
VNRPPPTTARLSRDTTVEAEQCQIEIWRRMTPAEKLALVNRASIDVANVALAGVRPQYPGISEREAFLRLVERRLGRTLVRKDYPDATGLLGPL